MIRRSERSAKRSSRRSEESRGQPASVSAWRFLIVGDRLARADASSEDHPTLAGVVDISDPAAPIQIGHEQLSLPHLDVEVEGGFAYVASDRGLLVLDVSGPAHPAYASLFSVGSWPEVEVTAVRVADRVGYLLGQDNEWTPEGVFVSASGWLRILNVSDPFQPFEISQLFVTDAIWGQNVQGLDLANGVVFIGTRDRLLGVDVSDPAAPAVFSDVPAAPVVYPSSPTRTSSWRK
jgi:hypothetical protein